MQTDNKILDDLAKLAQGAAGSVSGLKSEVTNMLRPHIERMMREMDLVPRDEFDAVKATALKAREEQEKLEKRVTELEAALAGKKKAPAKKKAAPKKEPTKKK